MFRVAKMLMEEEAGRPYFFVLCDHRQCMDARRAPAVMDSIDNYRLSKKEFLKIAMEEGWMIDLEGSFCPVHARELVFQAKAAIEKSRQVVTPARLEDVLAFSKSTS